MKRIKTLIVTFGIFLLFVIGMFILLYQNSSKVLKQSLNETAEKQSEHAANRLQEGLDEVKLVAAELINNDKIQFFSLQSKKDPGSYEHVMAMREIRDMLTAKKSAGAAIQDITIYWFQSENVMSTLAFSKRTEEIDKILQFPERGWWNDEDYLYFSIVAPVSVSRSPEVIVSIRVSDSFLNEIRRSGSNISGSNTLIVFPDEKHGNGLDLSLIKDYREEGVMNRAAGVGNHPVMNLVEAKRKGERVTVLDTFFPECPLNLLIVFPTEQIMEPINGINLLTFLIIAFVLLVGMILMGLFYRQIFAQIQRLINQFSRVEKGDLTTRIETLPGNEFDYVFTQFNKMVDGTQGLMSSLIQEQSLREIAEMKQLQSQINPHFLYNSLFYIVSASDDAEAVRKMAKHLAEYYRYRTKSRSIYTLEDELTFADHYLSIMSIRKELIYSIEMTDQYLGLPILPLLLQPLIENAIEHGIEGREGANTVYIEILDEEMQLLFRISDDGVGLSSEEQSRLEKQIADHENNSDDVKIGLWNVHHRLVNYYGKSAGLQFSDNQMGGLTVSFLIPLDAMGTSEAAVDDSLEKRGDGNESIDGR